MKHHPHKHGPDCGHLMSRNASGEALQLAESRLVAPDGTERGLENALVELEESLAQFGNFDRLERQQRRSRGREIRVDLSGELFRVLGAAGDLASNGLPVLAVVEPPAAVMRIERNLADAPAASAFGTSHRNLPCTECAPNVHQTGVFASMKKTQATTILSLASSVKFKKRRGRESHLLCARTWRAFGESAIPLNST
jgi:hypothetical protein